MNTLKARLEYLQKGFTQREFSEKIGVPLNTYTAWLREERLPSFDALQKICTVLCVNADWLLLGRNVSCRKDISWTTDGNGVLVDGSIVCHECENKDALLNAAQERINALVDDLSLCKAVIKKLTESKSSVNAIPVCGVVDASRTTKVG